jgi:hypothetical protein
MIALIDDHREALGSSRSRRYTALMWRLLRWFDGCAWREGDATGDRRRSIGEIAPELLDRRRRAAKKAGKGVVGQTPEERHQLRIALKKLRYTGELLGDLYDAGEVRKVHRAAEVAAGRSRARQRFAGWRGHRCRVGARWCGFRHRRGRTPSARLSPTSDREARTEGAQASAPTIPYRAFLAPLMTTPSPAPKNRGRPADTFADGAALN